MAQGKQLQMLYDSDPLTAEAYIHYRPKIGWWITYAEFRYFGDEGDFLGSDFVNAKKYLLKILKPQT